MSTFYSKIVTDFALILYLNYFLANFSFVSSLKIVNFSALKRDASRYLLFERLVFLLVETTSSRFRNSSGIQLHTGICPPIP